MAEYIEREILLKKNFYTENCNSEENRWNDYAIKDIIMHIPAADVVPVKHGHFRRLTFSDDTIICSECKMAYNIFETNGAENFNFCPHCGAKMGGEVE